MLILSKLYKFSNTIPFPFTSSVPVSGSLFSELFLSETEMMSTLSSNTVTGIVMAGRSSPPETFFTVLFSILPLDSTSKMVPSEIFKEVKEFGRSRGEIFYRSGADIRSSESGMRLAYKIFLGTLNAIFISLNTS